MIAIGTDIVAVDRFSKWLFYSERQLTVVFHASEIREYAVLHDPIQKVQFLATRFAVKEAYYKALSSLLYQIKQTTVSFGFRRVASLVFLTKEGEWELPVVRVDTNALEVVLQQSLPMFTTQVSLAHEKEYAVATVVLMWE